jgi:two-component system chemotaxis response regulator CheY
MFPPESQILIVDDMPSLREVLKGVLKKNGYSKISEANDGQEAYTLMVAGKASGVKYDLVICDWNMPNMTGLDFLKVVRAVPEWKTLPFLMLTTENEKAKVMEAIQAGASNYIVKPIVEPVVLEKLKAVWDKISKTKAS